MLCVLAKFHKPKHFHLDPTGEVNVRGQLRLVSNFAMQHQKIVSCVAVPFVQTSDLHVCWSQGHFVATVSCLTPCTTPTKFNSQHGVPTDGTTAFYSCIRRLNLLSITGVMSVKPQGIQV